MTYCVIARDFTVKRHWSWVDNGEQQLPVEVWHRLRVSRQSRLEAWNIWESRMIENKKIIIARKSFCLPVSQLNSNVSKFDSSLEVFENRGSSCEGRTTHFRVVLYVTDLLYILQLIKIAKKAANVKTTTTTKTKSPSSFNPLTPMSDQARVSPYSIITVLTRQVMRMKKNINLAIFSWSDTKFSNLTL